MKIKSFLVCILAIGLVGCAATDTQPDSLPTPIPDRGTIPILEPMMPPSMTNEWEEVWDMISNGEDYVYLHGAWRGKQKLIIEANGTRTEVYLARPFGSFAN